MTVVPFRLVLVLLGLAHAACSSSASPDASSVNVVRDADGGIETSLTGTLGALGPAKPTVSSLLISNSGETLLYMSSATISCEQLQESRWLGSAPAGAQVVEIVFPGDPKVGTIDVGPGEVNYAAGGKSSSYEVNADSGQIQILATEPNGFIEGTVKATYGSDTISGQFHATFCANGQGY